ncbi:hypothetical protein D3C77_670320 [compost metagenome]
MASSTVRWKLARVTLTMPAGACVECPYSSGMAYGRLFTMYAVWPMVSACTWVTSAVMASLPDGSMRSSSSVAGESMENCQLPRNRPPT